LIGLHLACQKANPLFWLVLAPSDLLEHLPIDMQFNAIFRYPCAAITRGRDLHIQQKLQRKFLRAAMKVWAAQHEAAFLQKKNPSAKRQLN
jgi:hypothetical protein